MMKQWPKLVGTAALALISACSQKGEERATIEPEETVFDPMIEAVERAKQVEQTHLDRVKDLNRTLDALERGGEQRAEDDAP